MLSVESGFGARNSTLRESFDRAFLDRLTEQLAELVSLGLGRELDVFDTVAAFIAKTEGPGIFDLVIAREHIDREPLFVHTGEHGDDGPWSSFCHDVE